MRGRHPRRVYALLAAGLVMLAGLVVFATGVATAAAHKPPPLTANTKAPCNVTHKKQGIASCFAVVRTPSTHEITADASGPPSGALGPADIQSAYNLPSATAGGGQTVAIVDAYGDSNAESDLAAFRSQYGLPPCTTANGCFKKVDQSGGSNYPPDDSGWGLETSLDLDAVSSACPKCNILLVEANSNTIDDLGTAVDTAVALGATAVSNSYGAAGEFASETNYDHYYDHPGVAVTVSSGDSGFGIAYPASSATVTSVGGTFLQKDPSVPRGWDESVWGSASGGEGTGSGCSVYEPKPEFQAGVDTGCDMRANADVSADASPASGLAVYDTLGYNGWLKVGGTSLSSPLVAAIYALAGTPVAGTYPASYAYHDTTQASDLFDITSGANGTCTPTVLCTAGTGWDGPTGLGSPDGTGAFTSGPQGRISGQVTDNATGTPVSGATVTANPGDYVTRTDAQGQYELNLAVGSYDLTASGFGYQPASKSGVQVSQDQTTSEDFTLTADPSGTLSGTVADGSGQGWPLHASITVEGDPNGPIWTNPYSGHYSLTLPQGDYTLDVSSAYPGYQDKQVKVTVGAATSEDITLSADLTACTAPGYGPDGLTQDFTGWTGGSAQDGWTVSSPGRSGGPGWRFDDPGNRPPPPSGSINPVAGTNDEEFVYFESDHFAVADAGYYNPSPLDAALTSPPIDLSGQNSPQISFDSAYYPAGGGDTAQVQLSTDGGHTWATVWQRASSNALGPISVAIPQAARKTGVQVRWRFDGSGYGYWAVGDVLIGSPACVPQPGGLVAGVVTDKTTSEPIGAQITSAALPPPPYPWPEGIAEATTDPALPGGFYWLFTPAGNQELTAAQLGYTTATAAVSPQANTITHQDWALTPAGGN